MLDKSVPFVQFVMRRPAGAPIPEAVLPEGYRFVFYQPGDEKDWARIETSVLEFGNEMDALLYFQKDFSPFAAELPRRMTFIESPEGEKIATATAWWDYHIERRDPLVHWVAVKPGHQGKGLGKAVVANLLHLMVRIEGDRDFYLHTQTYSHVAVGIYEKQGFVICTEPDLQGVKNDKVHEGIAILQAIRRGEKPE